MREAGEQSILTRQEIDGQGPSDGLLEKRHTWAEMAEMGANTSASASASPEGASESGSDPPSAGTAQVWLRCNAEAASPVDTTAHASVGSEGHDARLCKPCAFFHTKGCTSAQSCLFCHVCPPREKQDRKRLRRRQCQNLRSQWVAPYPQQAARQTPLPASGEWRSEHSRQTSGEWRSVHSRQTSGDWRSEHSRQTSGEWRLEQSRQMSSASAASTCTGWGNSSEGRRHSRQASTNSQTTAADTFSYTAQPQEKGVMPNVLPMMAMQQCAQQQQQQQQYVMPQMEVMQPPEMAYASMPQAYEQQQPLWEYPQLAAQEHRGYEHAQPNGYSPEESGLSTPEAPFAPPIDISSTPVSPSGAHVLPMAQPGPEYYGYCSPDAMMPVSPLSGDFGAEAQAAQGLMPVSPHGSCVYNGVQYAFVPVAMPPSPHGGYAPAQPWHDDMGGQVQVMSVQAPPQPLPPDSWVPPGGSPGQLQHFQGSHSVVVDGPCTWGASSAGATLSW